MTQFYRKNRAKQLSEELFRHPTSEYRGTPFWSWNNKLNKEQLMRQIDILHEMGFGGFHMHARTGLGTAYLSDEFMDMVGACVNKAKTEAMRAYLYDEDRWPSGFAGGLVTRKEEYRARNLLFTPIPYGRADMVVLNDAAAVAGRNENGILLGVYDIVLNADGSLKSGRKIEESEEAEGVRWYAYMETAAPTSWFNNQTYVDTLNPKAMQEFIRITYESYLRSVGTEFGNTVPSIFTDEPQFTRKRTLNFADDRMDVTLPWTPGFETTYRETYGIDILEHLPELIWDLPDGKPSQARYFYHDHISERFTEAFADQCGGWCEKHGIALTGHMMEEPTLQSQTAALGEAMRSYRSFGIPGIDMLCDSVELTTAKQAQSAVHQYGREGMLSELYGVTGWDFDFRGHKFQGDWQAALGVTVRVPHLCWVSMAGEAKRDYPASIFYQSPWYREYAYVEDHFARVNTAMTRGKPIVKIGVIHPVESCWLAWGPKESNALERQTLDRQFEDVTRWLLFGLQDFNFISEALLPSQCKKAGSPMQVGEMAYDVILVPGCRTLRSSTVERLRDFAAAGGKVIFMGTAPKFVDALPSEEAEKLAEQCTVISFDRGALYRAVEENREVSARLEDGTLTENLLMQYRQDNDCRWLFIVQGIKPVNKDIVREQKLRITLKGAFTPELYDTVTGKIRPVSYRITADQTVISITRQEYESLLFKLTPSEGSVAALLPEEEPKTGELSILEQVHYELTEDNALLLDMPEYALDDAPYSPKEEMLRADNKLREQAGFALRGGQIAQPWVTETEEEKKAEHTVRLRFAFESTEAFADCRLALESAEKAEIFLNGDPVCENPEGWYVDESIGTVKLPALRKGWNEIEIIYPFTEKLQLEWCYLLGQFGVKLSGTDAFLTKLPEKLGFGDIVPQGLPFYTGNIRYCFDFALEQEQNVKLYVNRYRGAGMRIFCDGQDAGMLVYPPYRTDLGRLPAGNHHAEILLYGNRYNGFGAVHSCDTNDMVSACQGPGSWRTAGNMFSYIYHLKKLGILKEPVIELYPAEE